MILVCGVDEAGRGPLAGPVHAAAVILDRSKPVPGLADSKKLSERKREALAHLIKRDALSWAIGTASVEEIDSINILKASLLAMERAVAGLSVRPDEILVDGLYPLSISSRAIVEGDSLVQEISAASILAKTSRDAFMLELHRVYPVYGFDRHKGYPTKDHIEALKNYGPSAVHRKSFSPVKANSR
ncbi:MAG TPA: ribonuclease HII [Burkholderiales bacterium]|nr:ribonuclease HII [Burkholderiales bacterium]